jgi:hypothetical protein
MAAEGGAHDEFDDEVASLAKISAEEHIAEVRDAKQKYHTTNFS